MTRIKGEAMRAGQDGGLNPGDCILEVNGVFMDGEDMNPMKQPIALNRGSQVRPIPYGFISYILHLTSYL